MWILSLLRNRKVHGLLTRAGWTIFAVYRDKTTWNVHGCVSLCQYVALHKINCLTLEDGTEEYPGITLPALLIRMTDLAKAGQRPATIEIK